MRKYNLNQLPKPIYQALAKEDIFTQALFNRPETLSSLLPYDEYNPQTHMFRHKDGSLGVVFECELLEHETMTNDQVMASVEGLKSWFTLPENCVLQILFDQSALSKHDNQLNTLHEFYPNGHSVAKTLFESRLNQIKDSCNSSAPLAPLRRRTWVSIRYFPSFVDRGKARNFLKKGEFVLYQELESFVRESRQFAHLITNFQHNSKIPLKLLGAEEVLDVLRKFFNPKTYYKRSFAPYNRHISISDQVLFNSPTLDYGGIEREGIKTRTLTLKTSPQYAYPGGMAYFTKLPFPFKLSLNLSFPSKTQVKTFFDMKEFFLQNTPSARARRQREEVLEVQERLVRDDRCLHLTFNVIVEGETDEVLDARVREVVNIFHNDLECEIILEDDIGLGLCLNSLPLAYNPKSDYSTQRAIRILRSDVTKFVPIFDSFRGLSRPLQIYLSRENNLVPFSLLENETSNHTVVLADSGSGKSAFIIDCIQAAKRMNPEPLVFVVDKKSSYTMLAEYFEGDLTVFDRTQEMPFSPFRGVYDEEKIAFLTNLVVSCVKLTSPSFEFDSTHTGAISKAIRLAHEKKVRQAGIVYQDGNLVKQEVDVEVTLSMDDFVAELSALPAESQFEAMIKQTEELLQKLTPFYGDGIYAQYFQGKTRAANSKPKMFYIYDLDRLDSDPILQVLMTMSVVEEIRRVIKLPENQNRGGFIVFEELGMLGRDNPTASRFILDAAETFRKLGFWLIGLTPRPQNYFELEAGRAMWSVADNFIFLQMSGDNVDYLGKNSTLLDEASGQIIKSLRTKRGQYAEVFYMNKKKTKQGAFRYFQTPLDRWLAPTNSKDAYEASEALKRFKNSKWQALEYLAKTFPNGVENAVIKKEDEKS